MNCFALTAAELKFGLNATAAVTIVVQSKVQVAMYDALTFHDLLLNPT